MSFLMIEKNKTYRKLIVCIELSIYCLICYSVWFFDKPILMDIATEDGALENLTAIYFLITSILFMRLYLISYKDNIAPNYQPKKNVWFLLLGIIFLFGTGEEISWGQRIFSIPVPEMWKQINVQQELNIHNIYLVNPRDLSMQKKVLWKQFFTINVLYAGFALLFCFIIPLIKYFSRRFQYWLEQIRLPAVPLEIGSLFVITYLIDKTTKLFLSDMELVYPNEEIREHIWACLFFIIAVHWTIIHYVKYKNNHCRL